MVRLVVYFDRGGAFADLGRALEDAVDLSSLPRWWPAADEQACNAYATGEPEL